MKIQALISLAIVAFLVSSLVPLSSTQAGCPPYRTEVVDIQPSVDGLEVNGSGCSRLIIQNNTKEDIILFDGSSKPIFKITPTDSYRNQCWQTPSNSDFYEVCSTDWEHYLDQAHNVPFWHEIISYPSLGAQPYRNKEVVKIWVIHGLAGETSFSIIGRTIYTEHKNDAKDIAMSILIAIILITPLAIVVVVPVLLVRLYKHYAKRAKRR